MKNFKVTVDGQSYNVCVEELEGNQNAIPVSHNKEKTVKSSQSSTVITSENKEDVLAPMPGTILDIKTAVGSLVKAGDTVVVLEAMKMENDIVAPCDGKVVSITVKKGDNVNSNDILAAISK